MSISIGPINPDDPALKVYRNLPPSPPRGILLLAKMFGEKKISIDSGVRLTTYLWRDKIYLSNVEYLGRSV